MLNLIPFIQLREFDNSGYLLAGGKMYFYRAGSTTPLETFADANGSILNTNPVVLDASGSAKIFLLPVKYRVEIYDYSDTLIHEIDNIGASDSSASGTGSFAIVKTYDELRNLTEDYDVVLVTDPLKYGFFIKSDSTAADDDGCILIRQSSTRYIRALSGYIDPVWYGLEYDNAADQSSFIEKAITASISFNLPIRISGSCYLATNVSFPSGSRLIIDGSFVGSLVSPPSIIFEDGSKLESCSNSGIRLPCVFGSGCVDDIRSSWFGGGDDIELSRIASQTAGYRVIIDKEYNLGASISFPENLAIDFSGGMFTVDVGNIDISIANLVYSGLSKILNYTDNNYIETLSISTPMYPEWAGAVGDGINDDSDALQVAFSTGSVKFSHNKKYKLCRQLSTDSLTIVGDLVNALVSEIPLTSDNLQEPQLQFGVNGSVYNLSESSDTVTLYDIPSLKNDLIVNILGFNSSTFALTSPGYLYKINNDNSVVKYATSYKNWKQLFVSNNNLYGLCFDANQLTSEIWRFDISGNSVVETLVYYSDTDVIVKIVRDISTTIYALTSNWEVRTLDPSTFELSSSIGAFTNVTIDFAGMDDVLYGIVYNPLSNVYSIESMTTGGTVSTFVLLTGYSCKAITQLNHNLYIVPHIGNIVKVTNTGVISQKTNDSTNKIWHGISTMTELVCYSKSIISPFTPNQTAGHILSPNGNISFNNLSLNGFNNCDNIGYINATDGTVALDNCVSYNTITDGIVNIDNSVIDNYLDLFSTSSTLINTLKSTNSNRCFYDNIEFKTIYLTNNKRTDLNFDTVLTTDIDGVPVSKTSLILDDIKSDTFHATSIIQNVSAVSKSVTGNYSILDTDPQFIIVTNNTSNTTITLPKEAGATNKIRYVVNDYKGGNVTISGDVLLDITYPVVTMLKTMVVCVYIDSLQKWAIS